MTITSSGYTGTVSDEQWAEMVPRVGSTFYAVNDPAAFKVTIAGGTRTVSVAAGGASAVGIYDVSNAPITKTLSSVPSGSRWDLIVLRRTWGTKVTSVEVVQGGSTKALPERTTDTGTTHDQPLALARVDSGSTSVQEVVDLRCISGDGGLLAFDVLALTYLDRVGTSVRIGDIQWYRGLSTLGSPVWVSSDMADTGWVTVPYGTGWGAHTTDLLLRVRRVGAQVELRGAAKRTGADASIGWLGTIPETFRPSTLTPLGATYGSAGMTAEKFVSSIGVVAVGLGHVTGSAPLGSIVMLQGSWLRG